MVAAGAPEPNNHFAVLVLAAQPPPPVLPWRRSIAAAAALLLEYQAVSFLFDVQPLRARLGWIGWAGDAAMLRLSL